MVNTVRTRNVVGAGYGFGDWLLQRVTAIMMMVYVVVLALCLLALPELNRESWHALMAGTFMRVISVLFIVSVAYHAWVGVRNIWMDYIKPLALRIVLHSATALALIACAGWATQILWRL
ncbi:MAG: succinate dehydrogenase, hydrophobic membrane anchor protein [Sterolibacterium sp.]|nr:succinate dehydrogenase, hydrophobic membrane anchor protein [Sterolibacterium sp.]